ncbi:MAG: MFS transporter [Ktedonobacterales bacterium]|nr:MFS transporter [Ktedonobacterales bacterium]
MNKTTRSPIVLMALTIFVDFTGFGLIIPLLPFWAKRLGADAFGVGLVLTVYALAQLLFTPILGSLSDRYGRRPIILASLGIEACGFALTALSGSLPLLLLARFVGGLGASNIGSAQAVVADVTPPEGRARGMGLIGAAIGLGFVVGPALGGTLATHGLATPFWVGMGVALANTLLVARFLPETRRHASRARAKRGVIALTSGWRRMAHQPVIARLVTINLLFTMAFSAMEAVFPLLTLRRFGWGAAQNGYLFTYIGVLVVGMQGGLVGRLVKRWGERRLLFAGLALLAGGLALLPVIANLSALLLALGFLSVGEGAVTPTISALLSLASSADAQGETLGLAQGVSGLGRVLGPLLGGALFALVGASAPFVVGSALALCAAGVAAPSLAPSRAPVRLAARAPRAHSPSPAPARVPRTRAAVASRRSSAHHTHQLPTRVRY